MSGQPPNPQKQPQDASQNKAAATANTPKGGGIKPWLPLMANLLLMPAVAWATAHFLISKELKVNARGTQPAASHSEASGSAAKPGEKDKFTAALGSKIIVNVAGTMGTRYLLANLTLVGNDPNLKSAVEENDAQLRDVAASILSIKTISDLEKPGARNMIRTELSSEFNRILGKDKVKEIYLTEFAIQ